MLNAAVEKMFYLMLMTSGGCPRGTEHEGIRYANGATISRSVYFINGRLAWTTMYNKTISTFGPSTELVIRTPPTDVSRLVVFVLSMFYPTAARLCGLGIYSTEQCNKYYEYLYVKRGKEMSARQFGDVLEKLTDLELGKALRQRDIRHVLVALTREATNKWFGDMDEQDLSMEMAEEMMNHKMDLSRKHYAVESGLPSGFSSDMIGMQQRQCSLWHMHLGFQTKDKPAKTETDEQRQTYEGPTAESLSKHISQLLTPGLQAMFTEFAAGIHRSNGELVREIRSLGPQPTASSHPAPLLVHPSLQRVLSLGLPSVTNATFRSPQQAEVMQLMQNPDGRHQLYIAGTGSGKTNMVLAVAANNTKEILLYVTPFVATSRDAHRRFLATPGVTVALWEELPESSVFDVNVVVVSAHVVSTAEFRKWCKRNVNDYKRVTRIVVDEAHEIFLSSSYRECFSAFYFLTTLQLPITFLTATIFPRSVPSLLKQLEIEPSLLHVFRETTHRRNIQYDVTRVANEEMVYKQVFALVQSISLAPKEKGIIFCMTKADVHVIADASGFPIYHGTLDPQSQSHTRQLRQVAQDTWFHSESGPTSWIVATQSFGQGIDEPRVRYCIHVGMPGLLRFTQESGRLGRDDEHSFSHVIHSGSLRRLRLTVEDPVDNLGVEEAVQYIKTDGCLRLVLGKMDDHQHSCTALGAVLCQNCRLMSKVSSWQMFPQLALT